MRFKAFQAICMFMLFSVTALWAHEGHQKASLNISEQGIIGNHHVSFQLIKGWGKDNLNQFKLHNCQGFVTDSKNRLILLTDNPKNNIIIFNPMGKVIKHWTLNLKRSHGLSIHKEKNGREVLFITDNAGGKDAIFKTTLDGKVLRKWGYPKESGKYKHQRQYRPSKVLVKENGEFYVLDGYGKNYIIHYDDEGNYKNIFGGDIGKGEAQLKKWGPHGGAIDTRDPKNPVLLIACSDQKKMKRFSLDGKYLDTILMPGGTTPRDVVIHGNFLYVPHLGSNWPRDRNAPGYISVLDKNNKVIANLAGTEPVYEKGHLQAMTHKDNTFVHPHALTFDSDGNLYVAQWLSKGTWPLKFKPLKKL